MRALSIGRLAKAANVSIDTVRFYEKSGLLPPAARRPSGFREYTDLDLRQLVFIRRARGLGFSVDEIGELLHLNDETDFQRINAVIAQKRSLVDSRINELQRWREALNELDRFAGAATRARILDSFETGAGVQGNAAESMECTPHSRFSGEHTD